MKHYIEESHKKCESVYGMNRRDIPYPKSKLAKEVLIQRQQAYKDLLDISRHFMKKLLQFMEGTPTLVLITDDKGYVLEMYGDQTIQKQVHALGIYKGSLFQEKDVGTNSLSFALKLKRPVQLIGKDHFHYCLHSVACLTAPFFYNDSKKTCGTISILTTVDYASSFHLGLLSSAVDSIERELKINEQNKRLNLLHQVMVESTRNGIIITNTKGTITEFNPVGEIITTQSKQEVLNQPIDRLEPISFYMKEVIEKGFKFENLEVTFPSTKAENKRVCLFDALPIYDENQQLIGAFGQFRDITERLELQKQVVAAEKLSILGKLGAGFAHEIRNPLTSVIGFIELVKSTPEKELSEKHLKIISGELERMKSLVNQFVLMAKPSTNMKKVSKVTELIQETIFLLESQASKEKVTIKFDSDLDWQIQLDESQMKQVLMNLIQNAMEATDQGGTIRVSISDLSEFVQITIEDDGEGMTQEQMTNVFTPFYTTKENGLGLGLAICKQIIEGHNGKIEVTSIKGDGTTFSIYLRK